MPAYAGMPASNPDYYYANTPINIILLLALLCHPNNPVANTVLLPTQTIIVPMCLRSTDRLIDELYIQLLLPPDARTVLLPESDNCRAYTPAIHRPTDSANTPAIIT